MRQAARVDQQVVSGRIEGLDGAGHRQERGSIRTHRIDLRRRYLDHRIPNRLLTDRDRPVVTLRRTELLGIEDAWQLRAGGKHHGGSDQRASQRTGAGFVGPRHKTKPFGPQLRFATPKACAAVLQSAIVGHRWRLYG
jgi:hypothetical protein